MNYKTPLKIIILLCLLLGGIIILSLYLFKTEPPETVSISAANVANTPKIVPVKTPEQNLKLQNETDSYLKLFDNMPPVPVYLSNAPVNSSGGKVEKGVAYTTCESAARPEIWFKKDFALKTNQRQLTNIIKHELTHAWLCRQNEMASGHGELFQKKFKSVGGFGN